MNWFTWKQYRKQFGLGLLYVLALVVFMQITHYGNPNDQTQLNLVRGGIVLPLLLGMFWGAPLLSKEYEDGTVQFAWTQGISRTRWLTQRLLPLILATILYELALSSFTSRWWPAHPSRFDVLQFDMTGIAPAFYGVFAVTLGLVIGAWRRHVISAIALTLCLFVAVQYTVATYVRPHYMHPVAYTYPDMTPCITAGAQLNTVCPPPPQTKAFVASQRAENWALAFPNNNGVTYQPASRYWSFQLIEAGIYTVLIGLTTITAYRLVLKQDA